MTTITVNGYQVTVDDSFLKLSPEEQKATVDEIAKELVARQSQLSGLMKGAVFPHGIDPAAIAKAHEAGYSDDEIVAHLSATVPEQFKQAKQAGYSSKEILDYLVGHKAQTQALEITTADKINATLQVFTSPQFYVEMAFLALLFLGVARAKRTARSIPTKVGRLGLVLHWAALLVAVVLLGAAGLLATQAKQLNDAYVFGAVALGISALVIWLVGKAFKYILTGPTETPQAAHVSPALSPVSSAAPVRAMQDAIETQAHAEASTPALVPTALPANQHSANDPPFLSREWMRVFQSELLVGIVLVLILLLTRSKWWS